MITEARAREIWSAKDLSGFTRTDCQKADEWIRAYASKVFSRKIKEYPTPIRDYLNTMVRCHFGSMETDKLLTQLGCYPDWMKGE